MPLSNGGFDRIREFVKTAKYCVASSRKMKAELRERYPKLLFATLATVAAVIVLATLLFSFQDRITSYDEAVVNYIVVLDAGSTHTAVFVYRWRDNPALAENGANLHLEQLAAQHCEGKHSLLHFPPAGVMWSLLRTKWKSSIVS